MTLENMQQTSTADSRIPFPQLSNTASSDFKLYPFLALFKLNEYTSYIIEPFICARYQKVANDDDYNEDNDDDSRLHNITGHPLMFSIFFRVAIKLGVSTFMTFASITTNDSCPNYQNK